MAHILLVEDHPDNATVMSLLVRSAGHVVVRAANGLEALERLEEASFDLLVTDIRMPDLDGIALTRTVRGDSRYHGLRVLAVTALAGEEEQRAIAAAGVDAIVIKPFSLRGLQDAVQALLTAGS